jgi:hypothetical protein
MTWSAKARQAALIARRRHLVDKAIPGHFVPYARVNKRSQTAGYNYGVKISGTGKRLVTGTYVRLENVSRTTATDRVVGKVASKAFPKGTKRRAHVTAIKNNVSINNPAIRASVKGHQVRLGTSRGAGPTIIVRRGKHKVAKPKSKKGVQAYDKRMRTVVKGKTVAGVKMTKRPQRRKAARRKNNHI